MKKLLYVLLLLLVSCDETFLTHPYDVNIKGETGINSRQMAEIERRFADRDTLRVAFISDTHLWHSDANDGVADINRREGIDFVIHCGDLTDTGTTKEYEWSRDILDGLHHPYGPMDFSFIAARVKFVCLNTNATEYDYMAAVPNFDYMEEEFTKDSARFDRTIIVMHAPPYSDQFNNNVCKAFRRYLDFFPGLMCCVYGHNHSDKVNEIYGDGLLFYGIDCAEHRNYRIMTITPDGYEMEQIRY